jgi:glutamine synthetase
VPAADEPPLHGAADRRLRLELLPRDGAGAGRGLEGVREQLDPGEPVNVDTYTVPDADLAERGVHRLPRNLGEAIDAFEADELARETFGAEFHTSFVELKRVEWEGYNTVISQWEREQYLHLW